MTMHPKPRGPPCLFNDAQEDPTVVGGIIKKRGGFQAYSANTSMNHEGRVPIGEAPLRMVEPMMTLPSTLAMVQIKWKRLDDDYDSAKFKGNIQLLFADDDPSDMKLTIHSTEDVPGQQMPGDTMDVHLPPSLDWKLSVETHDDMFLHMVKMAFVCPKTHKKIKLQMGLPYVDPMTQAAATDFIRSLQLASEGSPPLRQRSRSASVGRRHSVPEHQHQQSTDVRRSSSPFRASTNTTPAKPEKKALAKIPRRKHGGAGGGGLDSGGSCHGSVKSSSSTDPKKSKIRRSSTFSEGTSTKKQPQEEPKSHRPKQLPKRSKSVTSSTLYGSSSVGGFKPPSKEKKGKLSK